MLNRRTLATLFACALAAIVTHSARSAEPTYQSKSLSQWLKLYEKATPESPNEKRAKEAVRAIGTNAPPYLAQMLTNDDLNIQWAAVNAFEILGPLGAPAIPRLNELLTGTNQLLGTLAGTSLGHIGAPALPVLLAGLTNRHYRVVTDAALAIVELGTNASPAIPIFLRDLQSPNHFVRERAADALGNLQLEPDLVVPALTNLLTDASHAARFLAMKGLGQFGPAARSAVPAIRPLLTDLDLKEAATDALRQIAPEILTNTPAP
jgi:HEAT repeat protein